MKSAILISIPGSHYVERARWALNCGGLSFTESRWPPVIHYIGSKYYGLSSRTVPALVLPTGQRLTDSADILKYVHATCPQAAWLYPEDGKQLAEVQRLEKLFTHKLGVPARVVIYQHLFSHPKLLLTSVVYVEGISAWKRWLFHIFSWPITMMMKAGMRINAASAVKAASRVEDIFSEVDRLLKDGRPFLLGDHMTAADLTFAAMAALVVLPPEYPITLPSLGQMPADFYGRRLRETPAGQHALKMYKMYRNQGPGSASKL